MVKDAEENAEADKKLVELIQARNSAEGAYNNFKKDFDAYKDQVTEEERTKAEEALNAIQEAIKGEDVEAINSSVPKLYEAIGPITAKKYEAEEAAKKDSNVEDVEVKETVNDK
jgi:molecular chaperone DnaK